MNISANNSMNISEIISNKIATSKPHARILTDIQKEIHSLYNNSVTLNTPIDITLSILKHIEDKSPISENINSICNLELVDKDSLNAMIDIHHREKKKDYLTINRYSDTLKEIDIKATDKEIKLTKEFIKLSDKITTGHTIIKRTIDFLDSYFQSGENILDETLELEKKENEYQDQKKILSNLIKYNALQKNVDIEIEEKVSSTNKYNEKLNETIEELKLITLDYTLILDENNKFKKDINNNKILEVMTKHIEGIKKINTAYLNF